MATLDDLLYQVNAFNTGFKKTASFNSNKGLADFFNTMGKVAEETENDEDGENEDNKDEEDEEKKEGSYLKRASKKQTVNRQTTKKVAKRYSPQQMANYFKKVAILDNPDTQGTVISTVGEHEGDGYATEKARETDNIISFDAVEEAAEENPQKQNDSETKDLIEDEAPNSEALVQELKEGSLHLYTKEESEALQKFASLGYQAYVDIMSTKLAEEEINRRTMQKQADLNLDKIAEQRLYEQSQLRAQEEAYQKMAYLKQTDPATFYRLKVAAAQGLL